METRDTSLRRAQAEDFALLEAIAERQEKNVVAVQTATRSAVTEHLSLRPVPNVREHRVAAREIDVTGEW